MLSPHVCPRCHSPIRAGRLACARCGLVLDPTTHVPGKAAPITTPLIRPEPPIPQQAAPNRAIGGVLALILVLGLVVAAGVTQMNSSADGSVTPNITRPVATRTSVAGNAPTTAPISSPTLVPDTQTPPSTMPSIAPPPATAASTANTQPTSTPIPSHTATPRPPDPPTIVPVQISPTLPPPRPATSTPVPGIGGLVNNWNGWAVGVASMAPRQQIDLQPGVGFAPSIGTFWLIWVDARNDGKTTRSLGGTVDFLLKDNNGNLYAELSDHGTGGDTREIARIFGRDYLNRRLAPGGVTNTLLVFDIPSGATPTELTGRLIVDGRASLADPLRFDLTKK